jgi:hypothetical protein
MCLPFLNLFVRYDAVLCGWCVVYVGDAIDGVVKNQLDIYATGCNTQR